MKIVFYEGYFLERTVVFLFEFTLGDVLLYQHMKARGEKTGTQYGKKECEYA